MALELCYELQLSPTGCRAMSVGELRKILGSSNNDLTRYLHTLVRQVGAYTIGGATYKYSAVDERVSKLEQALNVGSGLQVYAEAHGKSFKEAPTRSEYKCTGDRHYNWWTNMRKDLRQKLFLDTHGVLYDYDIEAAKPTLTLQAWRNWMDINFPTDHKHLDACKLTTWSELVNNRTQFRAALSHEVGISDAEAKVVCQNVLNSAFASTHHENGICEAIGKEATERLMKCELYVGLRADFKTMWSYLKKLAPPGTTAGQYMSRFYDALERKVMDVIERELEVDAWFIHDGFMTCKEVNTDILEAKVRDETGWNVKLEMKKEER